MMESRVSRSRRDRFSSEASRGIIAARSWVLGSDPFSAEPLEVIVETGVLRTLRVVEEFLASRGAFHGVTSVKVRNWLAGAALEIWV